MHTINLLQSETAGFVFEHAETRAGAARLPHVTLVTSESSEIIIWELGILFAARFYTATSMG
jgi:hypothetical protein